MLLNFVLNKMLWIQAKLGHGPRQSGSEVQCPLQPDHKAYQFPPRPGENKTRVLGVFTIRAQQGFEVAIETILQVALHEGEHRFSSETGQPQILLLLIVQFALLSNDQRLFLLLMLFQISSSERKQFQSPK